MKIQGTRREKVDVEINPMTVLRKIKNDYEMKACGITSSKVYLENSTQDWVERNPWSSYSVTKIRDATPEEVAMITAFDLLIMNMYNIYADRTV